MKIQIEHDNEPSEFTEEEIIEEFSWHNMRDSNHSRVVRRKIFEAVLKAAKASQER